MATNNQTSSCEDSNAADSNVPLAREAGVPFCAQLGSVDPFVEWLSLMEVVQMLCPDLVVCPKPTLGNHWKL